MSQFSYEKDIEQVERIKQVTAMLAEGVATRSSMQQDDWKYDPQIRGCLLELHNLVEEFMISEGMGKYI
ncbi:MAG: hypothetical protein J6U28_08940 [Bacteroidales bacterium]|nr:hypothetical protein [Bacteroidales bacterium]